MVSFILTLLLIFQDFNLSSFPPPWGQSPKTNQFLFKSRLNFVTNFIAIGSMLRPAAHPQNCDTYPPIYPYIYIFKLLNGGCLWDLGAMIGKTMMKFTRSRSMGVSAIGIFLRNLPKNISKFFLLYLVNKYNMMICIILQTIEGTMS